MKDKLTADEALAVYDVCRFAVHARRVQVDEDTAVLQAALLKLRSQAERLLCGSCHDRPAHAKGLCDTCYRRDRRTEDRKSIRCAS